MEHKPMRVGTSCKAICWLIAVFLGLFVLAAMVTWAGWSWSIAVVLGLIAALGAGWVLTAYFCVDLAEPLEETVTAASGLVDNTAAEEAAKETEKANAAEAAEAAAKAQAAAKEEAAAKADAAAKEEAAKAQAAAAAEAAAKAAEAAKEEAAAKAAEAAQAATEEKEDGETAPDETTTGVKPDSLDAARDGKPDDLKKIKGIGPKMEIMCNELGFYHYDQIAVWTTEEIAWVDENLKGFKGRVTRDDWVGQAKLLASGGETDFSKRVDKGGVY